MKDPVFVVNGKYVIDGASAGGTVKVCQILNWMARRHLEMRAGG